MFKYLMRNVSLTTHNFVCASQRQMLLLSCIESHEPVLACTSISPGPGALFLVLKKGILYHVQFVEEQISTVDIAVTFGAEKSAWW